MVSELLNTSCVNGYKITFENGEWYARFNCNGLPNGSFVLEETEEKAKESADDYLKAISLHNLRTSAKCADMLRHEVEKLVALGEFKTDAKHSLLEALKYMECAASDANTDVQFEETKRK